MTWRRKLKIRNRCHRLTLAGALLGGLPLAVFAGDTPAEAWSLHGQYTMVKQRHGSFRSPYVGDNSLLPSEGTQTTMDATLYLGRRLWEGAEVFVNPELDQGFGLSGTLGAAGFASGEAYKVGHHSPYGRLQRAFLRQTLRTSDTPDAEVTSGPNTLGGSLPLDNLRLTLGKFSVVDLFDVNSYAHDPRSDFLNWAVIDAGAFDYAADSWGFSLGGAAEWTLGDWTWRAGLFSTSHEPNSPRLDHSFAQHQSVFEVEYRHQWHGHPGRLKVLAFSTRARLGAYEEAVALSRGRAANPAPADTSQVRRNTSKQGYAFNLEQDVAEGVGLFARYSRNDGKTEADDFTDINRSFSAGLSIQGSGWGEPGHSLGLALAQNALSDAARRYFAAGGLGLLIGDGRLPQYGPEQIAEAYYAVKVMPGLAISLDLQRLVHPAYNTQRGPVTVLGARLHAEF